MLHGLTLAAIGSHGPGLPPDLPEFLAGITGYPCKMADNVIDPEPAYNRERGQYNCRVLLPLLDALSRKLETRVLGIADVDLYSPVFTFVFGEARLGGQSGLFSMHRLRPDLYGLPEDIGLIEDRVRREALHEVGHLIGLAHCLSPECVMRFSGAVEEVDLKPADFCVSCRVRLSS